MASPPVSPLVAIANTDAAIASMLRVILEDEGLGVVVPSMPESLGEHETVAFLQRVDPLVVLYRVTAPYAEEWRRLRRILEADAVAHRQFIVITTDSWTVEERAGRTDPYPVIGEPFDLNDIVRAVRQAIQRLAEQGWSVPCP